MSQNIWPTLTVTHKFNRPVLALLLENPTTGKVIVGAAILHVMLVAVGLPSWQCPVRHGLGIPCPGCGLSRAITALFYGDWEKSWHYHAFAPLFVLAFAIIAVVTFLPAPQREAVTHWIDWVEQYSALTTILLATFVFYWLARLLFFREAFINLIMG